MNVLVVAGLRDTLDATEDGPTGMKRSLVARGAIMQTLRSEDLLSLRNLQEAKDVWQKLIRKYDLHTEVSAQAALDVYDGVAMHAGEKISKFMERVESLANLVMNKGRVVSEEDMCRKVKRGLPSEYRPVQLSIQASGVPLTMDYLRAQLLAFEMTLDSKPKALKTFMKKGKSRKPKKGPGNKAAVCWHCGEAGHIKPHCPRKNEDISKGTDAGHGLGFRV
eukprot:scaffold626_cov337-Pavlova_lutheri.AAC.68